MKNHYLLFLLFIFPIILGSCDSDSSEMAAEKAKRIEVMDHHDVVMPMMGTTNKVRKQLKKFKKDRPDLPEETADRIDGLIDDLDKADEGMMDWMNGFQSLKSLRKDKDHEAIMQYLDEQEVLIKQVGKDMTNSIQSGINFMEQFAQ
ncbi:MAG: hypothetical protein AAF960_23835 [Bacteroidota bacterium]